MYQSITIIGWLGRDPEMRYMTNGDPVTSMSVSTSREYKKNSEKVKETTWFKVSVFGGQAEPVNQYLHKGSMVLVEGRLVADPVSGGPKLFDKKDGSRGASFEIIAGNVRFFPKGNGGDGGGERVPAMAGSSQGESSGDNSDWS